MKHFSPFHDRYPRELIALVESKKWGALPLTDFRFFSRFLETMTENQRPTIERTADEEWRLQEGADSSQNA